MQKVKKSCRKLAQNLSCMDTPWVEPHYSVWSGGMALASLRTPTDSSEPVTGTTSAMRTLSHYSAGKGPTDEDDDNDDDDDDDALGFHINHH